MYLSLLLGIIIIICIFTVIPKKESFIDVDTKYLIKKKPVSFKCYKDHEEGKELINPGNVILPDIHFSSFTDKRVLNFDKFKSLVLNKVKKYKIDERFTEISNPSINIWKKEKINYVPNELDNILFFHKKELNRHFYKHIQNNENKGIRCPELIECKTIILKPGIIRIFESKNWYKFHIIYSYYIKGKVFAYTLFTITAINKKNKNIKIETIKLIGILHEQDINIYSGYTKKNLETQVNIYNNYPFTPYRTDKGYQRSDSYKNIITTKKIQKNILKQKAQDTFAYNHRPYCIGGKGNTKWACESSQNTFGEVKKSGTWDSICLKDSDCPFYKAN